MGLQIENVKFDQGQIRDLVTHPDKEIRAVMAQKICRKIRAAALTGEERLVVSKILSFIAKDSAAMVRRALAVTLKNSPNLPRVIAQKLINDVDSIAVPVLKESPVLTEEDLMDILRSKAAAKLLAVSQRQHLNGELVGALVHYGDRNVVASVAANDGAEMGVALGARLLDLYRDDDLVKQSFIARKDLPSPIVEKLITMVSGEVAINLFEKHEIPIETAVSLASKTRERAQIDFISQSWVSRDLNLLCARLAKEGRLTKALIVRAAACGQLRFVENALAALSGVSLRKAILMIHDGGPMSLKALCIQAGLTNLDYVILRAAVAIFRDMEIRVGQFGKEEFQILMLERVLSLPITLNDADSDYLLEKLDSLQRKH